MKYESFFRHHLAMLMSEKVENVVSDINECSACLRVLIVEDEPLTRVLLTQAISAANYSVVGAARNASDAIAMSASVSPDVLLVDIDLGDGPNGVDVVFALRQTSPSVGVVFLTSLSDIRLARPGITNPPRNAVYLPKSNLDSFELLVEQIESAFNRGQEDLSGVVPYPELRVGFTDSQLELMRLLCEGFSNVEIAHRRFTTVKSTENAISRLAKQLDIPYSSATNQRVLISQKYRQLSGK